MGKFVKKGTDPKVTVNGEVVRVRKGLPRTGMVVLPTTNTFLKQPNLVTLMSFDYKTLQIRILISVIKCLQSSIEESINGKETEQLTLFQDKESDRISLVIPTKQFGVTPNMYPQLKECLKTLATIPVELDAMDPATGNDSWTVRGLLRAYIPKETHKRTITIEIDKDIAKLLVNVDRGWTKFMEEIAMKAESKYTVRIYMLISSWKDKGGFSITIDRFRAWLKLEHKYPKYKDLYRWVLRPVYEELFEKADCWFEVAEVYRAGEKEPHKLNFKVIRAELSLKEKQYLQNQKQQIENLLFTHCHMKSGQINEVLELINLSNCAYALDQVLRLIDYVQNNLQKITNVPSYCHKSLINSLITPINEIGSEIGNEESFTPTGA